MKNFTAIVLLGAWVLAAPASASDLDEARLFDWYYSSESAYQTLFNTTKDQGRQGWLYSRMEQGQPIPQASARELAQDLLADPKLGQDEKAALSKQFAPEVGQLSFGGKLEPDTAKMEVAYAKMNAQMDELEASLQRNQYNKQSFPGFTANLRSGYIMRSGSGLMQGDNQSGMQGGANIRFNGQSDAGAFNFGLNANMNAEFGERFIINQEGLYGVSIAGMGFTVNDWGLVFSMGAGDSLYFGTLILASRLVSTPGNDFQVAFANDYSGAPQFTVTELVVGLPGGAAWVPNQMVLRKQGSAKYWPLTDIQAFYALEEGYFATYNQSHNGVWGMNGQRSIGSLWGILEEGWVSAAFVGAGNDGDELRGAGYNPNNTTSELTWGITTHLIYPWGGELFGEYAQNKEDGVEGTYTFKNPSVVKGFKPGLPAMVLNSYSWHYESEGYISTYLQKLSLITMGVELSHMDPLYMPDKAGPVSSSLVRGASSSYNLNPNVDVLKGTLTPWRGVPDPDAGEVGGKVGSGYRVERVGTAHLRWGTNLSNATGLMSNTNKMVLMGQTSFSWISIGLFGGSASQILPSGPWIWTSPNFEVGNVGFLWWGNMGNTYGNPPDPGATLGSMGGVGSVGCTLCTGGAPVVSPLARQHAFNRPTDGVAKLDGVGNTIGVHWQAISSNGYQSVNYHILVTKDGLGDNRLITDNVKYINYVSGNFRFDLQTLFSRLLPFTVRVSTTVSEAAPQAQFPDLGEPKKPGDPTMAYLTTSNLTAIVRYGITSVLSVVGLYGYETWRSNHSYYPVNIVIKDYGVGFDFDLNEFLTGLNFFTRTRLMTLDDPAFGQRTFNLSDTLLGTRLDF